MSSLFYNLGRHWGRKAVPAIRKSKLIWSGLTGNEEEVMRAETALGTAMAVEMRAATEPLNDPLAQKLVQDLCARLSARVRENKRAFHCEVIIEPFPNAMALPGGFIFLSNTLLSLCAREADELAFVLGHEIAHVVRGHAWDRMLNESVLRLASTLAAPAGALGTWLRQQGLTLLQSAHAQDSELEADELGLRLMMAAGFNPAGAIALMQRLQQIGREGTQLGQYFGTHPPAGERISQLNRWRQLIAQGQ